MTASNKKTVNEELQEYPPHDIKKAYEIVSADLLHSLSQAKEGKRIKIGSLGSFCKSKKMKLHDENGETYTFNKVFFKMSSNTKRILRGLS